MEILAAEVGIGKGGCAKRQEKMPQGCITEPALHGFQNSSHKKFVQPYK
jgi:hypothetical protein